MKLNETNNEQSAQPKPQIRWGRVNHNYKALRIAAAGALSWEHKVNKAYFVKVYENKKPACLLLITDGSIGDRERFFEKLTGTYCDVPLHLVAYEGLKTALAKTGLQPFYIKSGYGCRTLSVPLDKGQIFFLTEYRDNAGLLQYSLDFEMACDTHIIISADEVYRLTARLQKLLNNRETSFAALLTGFYGKSLQTSGAMLDSASDLVLDTYHMLDKLDVIYNTFHYD